MHLPITLGTASVLGLLFIGLSVLVTVARVRGGTGLGLGVEAPDGPPSPLLIAARRQAHFAEYVPFSLVLLGLLEAWGLERTLLLTFAGVLIVGRVILSFGINAKTPNPWRLAGNMLQWGVILAMSGAGAWRAYESQLR
jgi:uncharacterized membrane protein YecN with MAPEG domain